MLKYVQRDLLWLLAMIGFNFAFYLGGSEYYHYVALNVIAFVSMFVIGLLRKRLKDSRVM